MPFFWEKKTARTLLIIDPRLEQGAEMKVVLSQTNFANSGEPCQNRPLKR